MLAIVNSCAVFGMEAFRVLVEVDVSTGMPGFDIVGLPDAAVRESKERVRTAIKNSGLEFPIKRITVNLAPAHIKKEGANFDLPIAFGILLATGQVKERPLIETCAVVGELSLDGALRGVNGILAMSVSLQADHLDTFILPSSNAEEAALTDDSLVFGLDHLKQFVDWWNEDLLISATKVDIQGLLLGQNKDFDGDMQDVKGQESVKRGMEIAAAGGHNILLIGSPGSGKTMLARRMASILPDLTLPESLAVTRLYSIAGELPVGQPLVTKRPFRSPHHSASGASIIGGGRVPKPGEVSLAHNGVLFLDEMPEFQRDVLEALRQPLEDKVVTISRVQGRMEFAAAFQLVGAMNPCPCGFLGDPLKECTCTPFQVNRYISKLSGPLLDRIDMQIHVQRVTYDDMSSRDGGESSAEIRNRVMQARRLQQQRLSADHIFCNGDMTRKQLQKWCGLALTQSAQDLLKEAYKKLSLSGRSYDRLLKVARTIADLAGSDPIEVAHIAEAIQYRGIERKRL